MTEDTQEPLLPPAEVGRTFGVPSRTLREWSTKGKIRGRCLLAGRRHCWEFEVRALAAVTEAS